MTTRKAQMAQFRTTIEVKVPNDLLKYVGIRPKDTPSQSMLNELVKAQVSEDVAEALRTYGIEGKVKLTRKVQNAK